MIEFMRAAYRTLREKLTGVGRYRGRHRNPQQAVGVYRKADLLAEIVHSAVYAQGVRLRQRRRPSALATTIRHRGATKQAAPPRDTERRSVALDDTIGDITTSSIPKILRSHRDPTARIPRDRIWTPTAGLVWVERNFGSLRQVRGSRLAGTALLG